MWEAWQPHLIWMDMRMPVMDGYEATRRIKASTRGMATIVIALTASALEEDRSVILSEGCDGYLRKPFHEGELFAAAARHLGVRYVYEDVAPAAPVEATGPARPPADEAAALAARLKAADARWLGELEQATVLGDLEAIHRLAGRVAGRDPALAQALTRLASSYEHDRILAAIQQVRNAGEHDDH